MGGNFDAVAVVGEEVGELVEQCLSHLLERLLLVFVDMKQPRVELDFIF